MKQGNKKLLLLVLLIGGGITDSMANIHEQIGNASNNDFYLLITFLIAFIVSLVLSIINKEKTVKRDIVCGILIGIPNYFSARFLLLALRYINAVIVYPVYSIATLVVITLVGILIFNEKMSKKKLFALGIIIVALGLLNI